MAFYYEIENKLKTVGKARNERPKVALHDLDRPCRAAFGGPFLFYAYHIYGKPFAARTSARAQKTQTKSGLFGDISILIHHSGGATRNRTGGEGFADPCLTAWLWRRIALANDTKETGLSALPSAAHSHRSQQRSAALPGPAKQFTGLFGDGLLAPEPKSIPLGTLPPREWSGRRGSNPPPQPWQGCALPNELLPQKKSGASEWT